MGLDMYLILEDKQTEEIIEYAYYRKANALEGYFVKNYNHENCGMVKIDREMIDKLYRLLDEVRFNREKAETLFPVFPGPFFGSYNYDRLYHSYVDTICNDFYHAKFLDFDKYDLYYTSNW